MDDFEAFPRFIEAIDQADTKTLLSLCSHNQAEIVNLVDEIKNKPDTLDITAVTGALMAQVLVLFAIVERHIRECDKDE